MVHTLHTKEDFIYAYVVFKTVDEHGKAKNEGLYIYVEDMWIHDSFRRSEVFKELVKYIDNHPQTANAVGVYWRREKYNRFSKIYKREAFLKSGGIKC